jgi:rod shape determining protein RodA
MDWIITSLVFLLVCLVILAIYSTSSNVAGTLEATFEKQLIFAAVGLLGYFAASIINYRFYRSFSLPLYVIGGLLLVAVLVFGTKIHGTTGWIFIGGNGFQPVEFVKLFAIIMLARFFSLHGQEFDRFGTLFRSFSIIGLYLILILLEPDLGSAIIYLIIWLGLVFLVNVKRSLVIIMLAGIIISASIGWLFILKDYQKERVTNLFVPDRDSLSTGYNIKQSMVAIGSGGFWGRGLGLGPQSQLKFLPEQQTDFIFAVIAEELGFVGAGLTLVIFAVLFLRILYHARRSRDDYSIFLIGGVIIMIYTQVFINVGMNLGIAPVVGVPLPFVSAGGSSLITCLIAVGMIQSAIINRPKGI